MSRFSYPEVGATRDDTLPAGYGHLRVRMPIGHGASVFAAASDAVLSWRMHRALPVGISSGGRPAEPGVTLLVRLGIGPLSLLAPCEVIWAVHGERLAGFAYGTLPGHPEHGEEAFLVELDAADDVWLTMITFSRPAAWYIRPVGPLLTPLLRVYAWRCGAVLRKIANIG